MPKRTAQQSGGVFLRLLTTHEVAEILELSIRQVQMLITTQRLPATKVGHIWVVAANDVEAARTRRKVGRPRKLPTNTA